MSASPMFVSTSSAKAPDISVKDGRGFGHMTQTGTRRHRDLSPFIQHNTRDHGKTKNTAR